ncbi:MAG TPA: hypothetical protein VNG95_01970 [Gemmatimonadales bacterium]|nr:hypothetical protein [Gemmatimonadales bacterium]
MTFRPDLLAGAIGVMGSLLGRWDERRREMRLADEAYRAAIRRARERQGAPHGASPALPAVRRLLAA